MQPTSAVDLLSQVIYKPDWVITAADNSDRFEGTITVCVEYPCQQYNRDQAPLGYPKDMQAKASFRIMVGDCNDTTTLYRRTLEVLHGRIDCHEAREAFRIKPTYWAPFHPHKLDGMERWGDVQGDMNFGIV